MTTYEYQAVPYVIGNPAPPRGTGKPWEFAGFFNECGRTTASIFKRPLTTTPLEQPLRVPEGIDEWLAKEPPESINQEADRIVNGSRQEAYGHPYDDFDKTSRLWEPILESCPCGVHYKCPDCGHRFQILPEQVTLCMTQVKVSREVNRHKRDNLVDLAGYAATTDMIHEERKRRAAK